VVKLMTLVLQMVVSTHAWRCEQTQAKQRYSRSTHSDQMSVTVVCAVTQPRTARNSNGR
jgi:hypothetical protein